MPSPGVSTLITDIGDKTFVVEGGFQTTLQASSDTVVNLATAIDSGWTSSTPSTPTSMAASFASQFSYLSGDGLLFMNAIAAAIDSETALWAASYDPVTNLHNYIPTSVAIQTAVKSQFTSFWSSATDFICVLVSDVFIKYFEQEVG